MKKFILALLIAVLPMTSVAKDKKPHESWRDKVFQIWTWGDGIRFYIVSPSGELWFMECKTQPNGSTKCQFKKP